MKIKNIKNTIACLILLIIPAIFTGCQSTPQADADLSSVSLEAGDAIFALYQKIPVNINPSLKDYQVAVDLSNVTNRDQFSFSPEAKNLLAKNGFVVSPGSFSASTKSIVIVLFLILSLQMPCCTIIISFSAICCGLWRKTNCAMNFFL